MKTVIEKVLTRPGLIFVVDGLGAALSASIFLLLILLDYAHIFGIPKQVLLWLAVLPIGFALFDLSCLVREKFRTTSKIVVIAILNIGYCILSMVLICFHMNSVTSIGWLYFVSEVILVLGLAIFELKVAKRLGSNPT